METSESHLKDATTGSRLRGLWNLMRGFRGVYLAATTSVGFAALARTGIYFLLAYFIDTVLPDQAEYGLIPYIALAFILLAALQGGFTYVGGRLAARGAESVAYRLRNFIYDHIQRLTFTYHDRMQTGELLQRSTSDVDAIRRLFSEQLIGIGRIGLLFLVNFIALLTLNVRLALYSVVVLPLLLLLSIFFFWKLGAAFEANQEQEAVVSNRLQENLTGVRVVKAFARQAFEQDRFDRENKEQVRRGMRLIAMHGSFWPITDVISGLQMLAGYYIGARMAIDGTITPGTYVAYIGFVNQIIWPLRHLGRLVAQMSTGLVSLGRVREILREAREPLDTGRYIPADGIKGALSFRNVSFAYAPAPATDAVAAASPDLNHRYGERVLHEISFDVEPGQIVALLGGTGSGKTTLVNLLPRFYEVDQGELLLDGESLQAYPRGYLRRQIGIVQQEPFLFSTTIRENITYGLEREIGDAEVEAAARAAAIHEVILSFPNGYNTLVGERGVTLSGGQKQRLTLARTLLQNPRILILDDATSSVDTETEAAIQAALDGLMADRTTFIIAHRVQSVMHADLILVLDEGRIVQRGSHRTLVSQPGMYREIYELQGQIEAELADELAVAEARDRAAVLEAENRPVHAQA
jgi:ATP-binding cassette subfamily B protein